MKDITGTLKERLKSRKVIGFALLFIASTVLLALDLISGVNWVAINGTVYSIFAASSTYEKKEAIKNKNQTPL